MGPENAEKPSRNMNPISTTIATQASGFPLSFTQERLWFLDQLEGSTHYHLTAMYRMETQPNTQQLESAFRDVLRRHLPLRSVYRQDEEGQARQFLLNFLDWSLVVNETKLGGDALAAHTEAFMHRPFDLKEDFMLRAELVSLSEGGYRLMLCIHHIAFDGWSLSLLVQELAEAYNARVEGRAMQLPVLPISYLDYAQRQREQEKDPNWQGRLQQWVDYLTGLEPLNFPTDMPRPTQQSVRGANYTFNLDTALMPGLRQLAREHRVTLYMLLLSIFKVFLQRSTGQTDLAVGIPVANRNSSEVHPLIGFFTNTLVLRSDLSKTPTFGELVGQVKERALNAFSSQDIPFEQIVQRVGTGRDASRSPLFQVMFIMQNNPEPQPLVLGGAPWVEENYDYQTTKFDLTFSLTDKQDHLELYVEYNNALFLPERIERMAEQYQALVRSVIAQPQASLQELNALSEAERTLLVEQFNATALPEAGSRHALDYFAQHVAKQPEAVALKFREATYSYQALDQLSNQLAHLLAEQGVKAETLVAVCSPRTPQMLAAMLAIWKLGAAYIPVDPEYPQERIDYMLADAQANYLVLGGDGVSVPEGVRVVWLDRDLEKYQVQSTSAPEVAHQLEVLSHIIYTSGSTGKPKGVMLTQSNVSAFLGWALDEFGQEPFDTVFAGTSICFDLSVYELFMPLAAGKQVRLLEDSLEIPRYLADEQNVLINTVPSVVEYLLENEVDLSHVTLLNMAGEPISRRITEGLDLERIKTRNLYGPSEDTTYTTHYVITDHRTYIGKPIANTQIYLTDEGLNLVPFGAIGELCTAGAGVGKGYLNRPELTAEKFVRNPFGEGDLYRTGDLARWLPDGNLEFLGRKDHQVKIRGFRIELGEIETALLKHEAVTKAVVVAREDAQGAKQLVGYLVTQAEVSTPELQSFLGQGLPSYMVPAHLIQLETLPLTPNGKVDKRALPDPGEWAQEGVAYAEPTDEVSAWLASLWAELFDRDLIGLHDHFFHLGGHSLLATRVMTQIKKEYGVELPVKYLFDFPTVEGLAKCIRVWHTAEDEEELEVLDI